MSKIVPANSSKSIRQAVHLLREGEVIAFPTDTFYALGASAVERFAVRQIFSLKQQPREALTVFIYQVDDLNLVAPAVPNRAWPLLQKLWPGPLTVILKKGSKLPEDVTGGRDTVAVRIPDHAVSLELVTKLGKPLAVTSANLAGQTMPTTARAVTEQFGKQIPLVLEGDLGSAMRLPTIIDLSVTTPRLLHRGSIDMTKLKAFLPDLERQDGDATER